MIKTIEAELMFYDKKNDETVINRKYQSGFIVDFFIREDMFNMGQINFNEKDIVNAGEEDVKATITFLHWEYIADYVFIGKRFFFGQPSFPYGEGIILKI